MGLRQRIKKLEMPCDHARNYLIRDFDALCADRAMNVITSADRKMLTEARSLRTRGEDLSESHIRVLALYDQALAAARTQACDECRSLSSLLRWRVDDGGEQGVRTPLRDPVSHRPLGSFLRLGPLAGFRASL